MAGGFIFGTLLMAVTLLSDRVSPRLLFFVSAILAGLSNFAAYFIADNGQVWMFALTRVFTGVFLAGIYPIGMKIAASHYESGLGGALGWLVGALVIGTASPFALAAVDNLDWKLFLIGTSALAIIGGLVLFILVPDGPHLKKAQKFDPKAMYVLFSVKEVRGAALGYFGHSYELCK